MPTSPKPRCRICHKLHCTDPDHVRKPFEGAQRSLARPEYNTSAQRQRRAATVRQFLNDHGFTLEDGTRVAHCPECRRLRAMFIADHVVPIALGGTEDGALQVHCKTCSSKQGAHLANKRRKRAL